MRNARRIPETSKEVAYVRVSGAAGTFIQAISSIQAEVNDARIVKLVSVEFRRNSK